jgi:hypothetical protein
VTLFDPDPFLMAEPRPDLRCQHRGELVDWCSSWHPHYRPRCNRTEGHTGDHRVMNRKAEVLATWD